MKHYKMGDKLICTDCRKKLKNGKTLTSCFSCDCIFYKDEKEMKKLINKLLDPKNAMRLIPLSKKQIQCLTVFEVMCRYFNCHPKSQHGIEIKKFLKEYGENKNVK